MGNKYVEILHLHWSEGGNVILVVPMGEEALRSEEELISAGELSSEPRQFWYRSQHSTADLFAPDGERVGMIELAEVEKQIELLKGVPKVIELGTVTMLMDPRKLIAGSKFIMSPSKLIASPSLCAATPRNWEYTVHATFDGSCLSAEISQNSAALQNKNFNAL